MEHQIDFDFICADVFADPERFKLKVDNDSFSVNGETYKALVVPDAERNNFNVPVLTADEIKELGINDIRTSTYEKNLRYYHYRREDCDIYMFFNEAPYQTLETTIQFNEKYTNAYIYDAFANKLMSCPFDGVSLDLKLSAYESVIIIFGEANETILSAATVCHTETAAVMGPWSLTLIDYLGNTIAEDIILNNLVNINSHDLYPDFSGTMSYKTCVYKKPASIDLGEVFETAEVFINNKSAGVKIAPPYIIDISEYAADGENKIEIKVVNTLGPAIRDIFASSRAYEPAGLLGPVIIHY